MQDFPDFKVVNKPEEDEKAEGLRLRRMGKGVKFERIRRITGYLVGNMDRWNEGKLAEERDRVKHGI